MQTCTYLLFDGRCEEAFNFYAELLGGEIVTMLRNEDSPIANEIPDGNGDGIIHAYMKLGDRDIMASDAPPERYAKPQGFSVQLSVESAEEVDRIFSGLVEGGSVVMPVGKTFWSERFGILVDRFGIPWMINCAPTS